MEIDKEVCRRLYHYLCKTIGSEEVVIIRRRFFASVDYFTERTDCTLISSGSRAEGLEMGSDLDIMWLFEFVHISEERTTDSFLIPNNIVMDTDECKPCFSQLKGHSCHYDPVVNWVLTQNGQELRLESGRIRYLLLSITRLFRPFNLHGPCVSDETELGLCDLTVCLRCPVWINQLVGKSMDIHTNCPNKFKYKLVKRYLPYLFLGLRVDAVSSWMYLATYYYCIGKYKVSLQLIYHALRECTHNKLFYVNHKLTANRFSEFVKEGIQQKIWKLRHLYKNHVIHEISFYYNSRVIPLELGV
ncbi:unnamed protein product [Mytilus coruscus]|uniref:Uncharacterized protein n=1 Tax=Mytilus coruscus TaxID=42192 RepID=A0A6J8CDQ6_MYTCO|nr:unnamed protein product [Mytilus coruscus]